MATNPNVIPSSAMWEQPPAPATDGFEAQDIEVILEGETGADEAPNTDPDGTIIIPSDNGDVIVSFGGGPANDDAAVTHRTNLATRIDPAALSTIANSICEGID